jgi:hypothetical protein
VVLSIKTFLEGIPQMGVIFLSSSLAQFLSLRRGYTKGRGLPPERLADAMLFLMVLVPMIFIIWEISLLLIVRAYQ